MLKINKSLALFLGLFFTLVFTLLFLMEKLKPLLGHVAYYCQSFMQTRIIQIPYYLSALPLILVSLVLVIAIIKFLAILMRTQYLKYRLQKQIVNDPEITKLINRLELSTKIQLIKSKKPFAFCLGVFNQKVYISTGLVSLFTKKEIIAVLRHEQYHIENHDTVTMVVASIVRSLFPFSPYIVNLIKNYRIEREIAADKFAIQITGDRKGLLTALEKFLSSSSEPNAALTNIADNDTLEARICSLLNKPYQINKTRNNQLILSLFSGLVLVIFVVVPVHATEIHHQNHDVMMVCTQGDCINSCTKESELNKLFSQMQNSSHNYSTAR